jgi:hypothetical protein
MRYISYGDDFDTYNGSKNWQDIPLASRTAIVNEALSEDGTRDALKSEVMSCGLRKDLVDGLLSVISFSSAAEEYCGKIDSKAVLKALRGTGIGRELSDIMKGCSKEDTPYRMGELSFLKYSTFKSSPLDLLMDLPESARLDALRELLKSEAHFFKEETTDQSNDKQKKSHDFWFDLLQKDKAVVGIGYATALSLAKNGNLKVSPLMRIFNYGFIMSPMLGILGAFYSWLAIPIGAVSMIYFFKQSRRAVTIAALQRLRTDKEFFSAMRKASLIEPRFK